MLLLKWVGKKGKKAGCGIYPQNQTARSIAYIECKFLFSEQMILSYITIVSTERRSWIVVLFWKDKFDLIV